MSVLGKVAAVSGGLGTPGKHEPMDRKPIAAALLAAVLALAFADAAAAADRPSACAFPFRQANLGERKPIDLDVSRIEADGTILDASGGAYRQTDLVIRPLAQTGIAAQSAPRALRIRPIHEARDRWGRLAAHVTFSAPEISLAEEWVRDGLAIVAPAALSDACLRRLLATEEEARGMRKGLWRKEKVYWAGDPELDQRAGRFTLVEGRLLSIGQAGKTHYLNFGRDWSKDFTATIDEGRKSEFDAAGIDIVKLQGKRLRLRGVVTLDRGPALRLEHTAQIEVIDRHTSGRKAPPPRSSHFQSAPVGGLRADRARMACAGPTGRGLPEPATGCYATSTEPLAHKAATAR